MTLLNGENVSSMLIIDIFRLIDMSQAFPDPPRTELLDMNVVQLLASKCTKDNIVDLIRLHQLMKIELAPQVEGAGNLEELENEIEQVWLIRMNHPWLTIFRFWDGFKSQTEKMSWSNQKSCFSMAGDSWLKFVSVALLSSSNQIKERNCFKKFLMSC